MDEHFDVIVIGAGIVGLAVARAMAIRGRSVLVVERHGRAIEETSSRNSGVIHSGIYYPTHSLKARLCVEGRRLLYAYAEQRGIAHRRCGKLIVAQEGQQAALHALHRQALDNGVTDLAPLSAAATAQLEPEVRCAAALWCPSTGIVDVHELSQAIIADIDNHGGSIAYRTSVRAARLDGKAVRLECHGEGDQMEVGGSIVVNSAGLAAVDLLGCFDGYPARLRRTAHYAKGNYFSLRYGRPFSHLVYPMPNAAGLGIHATLDLHGMTRFGPNVEWVTDLDYQVQERHSAEFHASIRSYWPGLPDGALQPDYAGIRPKLVGRGSPAADFVIEGPPDHGCRGLVNLLGIESPGLTSCLAIGEHVADSVM